MNILFVTSSTNSMYHLSGKLLLDSFIKYQPCGDLLYITENFKLVEEIENRSNLLQYDISNYPFLINWLQKYQNYIPIELGGRYNYKLDKMSSKRFLSPIKTQDWNYKASLWFRKIASLHYAISNYSQYDRIIWIDNDCEIKQNMNSVFINQLFSNKDFFYFLGNRRNKMNLGIEAGFMGFNKPYGFKILDILFDYYQTGKFLMETRWDDGWIFKIICQKLKHSNKYNGNDLGLLVNNKDSNVMDMEPYNQYIIHKKGSHWRNNIDYQPK